MATLNSPLHPKALRYLAAVAQLGSVQAAAREVSISASAIDRQILMLEEDMGVPLFERLPRGMRLTAAGELLLALSQRWKTDLNRTLSDVKQLQGVSQGQLRLAAMDSHVNGFLPGFIHRVAQEHPGIVLEVDIVSTDEAVRCLTEGAVDLAIAFNLKPQRELHLVWTADLPLGCVAATGHALAACQQVTFKDVAAWPLAVQIARAWGAEVIALDLDPAKLALAKELGAAQTLNAGSADDIKALRKAGGVHVAVVTSAAKAAYDTALKCLRPDGVLSVVGLPSEPLSFPALTLVGIEARIIASSVGTRDDMRAVLQMAADGQLRCITETQPLAEVNAVFERMRRGQISGRVVLRCCGGQHAH